MHIHLFFRGAVYVRKNCTHGNPDRSCIRRTNGTLKIPQYPTYSNSGRGAAGLCAPIGVKAFFTGGIKLVAGFLTHCLGAVAAMMRCIDWTVCATFYVNVSTARIMFCAFVKTKKQNKYLSEAGREQIQALAQHTTPHHTTTSTATCVYALNI